jgi:WD40 repeat protein
VILIAASHEARAERVGDSRRRALAAVQEAWNIKPSPGLRNEAIAALSLPAVEFLPALGGDLPPPSTVELSVSDDSGRRRAVVRQRPGGRSDVIEILSVPDGKVLHRLEHDHRISCLDWSGDLLVAGGSSIRLVYVWDTATGRRLHRFGGHNADLEAVAFRPGGQEFVSIARDGMLRIWHAGLGAELLRVTSLPEHAGPVRSASPSRPMAPLPPLLLAGPWFCTTPVISRRSPALKSPHRSEKSAYPPSPSARTATIWPSMSQTARWFHGTSPLCAMNSGSVG